MQHMRARDVGTGMIPGYVFKLGVHPVDSLVADKLPLELAKLSAYRRQYAYTMRYWSHARVGCLAGRGRLRSWLGIARSRKVDRFMAADSGGTKKGEDITNTEIQRCLSDIC